MHDLHLHQPSFICMCLYVYSFVSDTEIVLVATITFIQGITPYFAIMQPQQVYIALNEPLHMHVRKGVQHQCFVHMNIRNSSTVST